MGDERLNRRLVLVLRRLADQPERSIPAAFRGWGETQAAYRFFDNEKVTAEGVLAPHREATLERVRQHPVVLCVEDTSASVVQIAVYLVCKRQQPPSTPPRLREILALVASLGGYLARTGDGPPGPKTIWIGLQRTRDFALAPRSQSKPERPRALRCV
ncbi:MAG TPA: hypothetical protein DD490_27080 [Acidobacteria bacterium]|nr:hypothetical protein [Acidobacteriota bacterium]